MEEMGADKERTDTRLRVDPSLRKIKKLSSALSRWFHGVCFEVCLSQNHSGKIPIIPFKKKMYF